MLRLWSLGSWAGKLIAATILISTFSATNSVILHGPARFLRNGQRPPLFYEIRGGPFPVLILSAIAIIALGVWSAILASAGKFAELAGGAIFIGLDFLWLGAAAIFPIRRASKGCAYPVSRPRISLDAHPDLCAGRRGNCRKFHLRGRPEVIPAASNFSSPPWCYSFSAFLPISCGGVPAVGR